jgi:Cu(I)/Ag(I) efflux system membrane fusion protein
MTNDERPYDPSEQEPMPEGEETAPRLMRTMAVVRWAILGAMVLFAVVMLLTYFGVAPWSHGGGEQVKYHCPMHPTYVSNQPGDCPICGMSLVPIDESEKEEAGSGRGSASNELRNTSHSQSAARPGQYTCPMCPEVVSDTAGECPKCGMDLVKVPEQSEAAHAGHDMTGTAGTAPSAAAEGGASDMGVSPVPGLVPVTIEPRRLQLIDVRTGAVDTRPLGGDTRIVGFITPDETRITNVHLRFSGWVKELRVSQTGQLVEKGERLFSVYSQELYRAEQDYVVARQALARGPAGSELADTRSALLGAARQRLELLGVPAEELARLDDGGEPSQDLWVPSPSSGYVMGKNVFAGQYVGPAQSLFSIVDLSRVWVLADVYEQDMENVKTGQEARMTTTAYGGESFGGKVAFIYPSVSDRTRTLKIRLEFSNPSLRLRPGMYVEVDLEATGVPALAVPVDAVMDDGDRQYVFVVHDGVHFEPRLVEIGRRTDDFMQVLSGLSEGEMVVTSANFLIDSESRLKAAMVGMGGTQPDAHAGHGK